MHTPRILSISNDPHLAWARQLVLESLEFDVESFNSSMVLAECQNKSFDVAVLGHTISRDEKRVLMKELRRLFPCIKVIDLVASAENPDPAADGMCQVLDGPYVLLETIRSVLSRAADTASTP